MDSINRFTIERNHPSLEGHFPGNPIVAGVIILDEISSIIMKYYDTYKISGFGNVKFLQPLLAEQESEVNIDEFQTESEENLKIKFSASYNGKVIAQGTAKLELRK